MSNDFLIFDPNATNIMSQADYLASGARTGGVTVGVADETLYNKAQRQSSLVIAALAQAIADTLSQNVVDAGSTTAALEAQIISFVQTLGRIKLMADATFYVATTGNDSNPGTIGSKWLTLQHAWNYIVQNLDLNGFRVTVNVADGTYTGGILAQGQVIGASSTANGNLVASVSFVGNIATPANCIIAVTNSSAFAAFPGAVFNISGFKITASGTGANQGFGVYAVSTGARINLTGPCEFGACGVACLSGQGAGSVLVQAALTISASSPALVVVDDLGIVTLNTLTVTLTGTPAFSNTAVQASNLGGAFFSSVTFSGAATGTRFSASMNAIVQTNSGAPNANLPGNANGTTALGGQAN